MRIIIAGAGEVGTHLAKLLTREQMDISLMDENPDRLRDLDANYDMLTRVGSPTSLHDLKDIGVQGVDLFIAVTPNESVNMTACLIANSLGAKRTLARIDNYEYLLPENKKFFENLGLNHLIYPEVLAAHEIEEALRTNWMRYHLVLCEGLLHLCVVKVRENSAIINRQFKSGYFEHGRYRIVALKRENETIIPRGGDEIHANDLVYFLCTKENIDFVREQAGKDNREIHNIVFMGASRITQKAVQSLHSEFNIKILEADRDLCIQLSEKTGDALIINADGRDMETMKEEGIADADAFIAVTDNSEANIFACLAAKKLGVRKTIAEVENIDYIPMAEGLDIGSVLNKKTIAASYIYQMLLNASVLNVRNLTTADAEIVEFMATDHSRITRSKIKDADLPTDVNIGAIVRAGEAILVNGDTQVLPGDRVVVFTGSRSMRKLDKYFK
ncbi:MAG: Trk system potassium transporter TrkA [Paludibacteraceae bacterium]|nr:Trk system potassium transporter TrkA [Paludibacteraceae bacterium]